MTILNFLYIGLGLWLSLIIFYTLFLASINLWENRTRTNKWVVLSFYPVLICMIAADFIMQVTVFTLLFLDPPRDLMVTYRLKRYKAMEHDSWRKDVANYMCSNLLNPFDPQRDHC